MAPSLFVYIKLEFTNEASQLLYKVVEKNDLTVQPVITYTYLCGWSYAFCLLCFTNVPFVEGRRALSELKCKTGWKNLYTIDIASYIDSCNLVHFSSNIYCARVHSKSVFWLVDLKPFHKLVASGIYNKDILLLSTPSFRRWLWLQRLAEWMRPRSHKRWITVTRTASNCWMNRENHRPLCVAKQQTWGSEVYRQDEKHPSMKCIKYIIG
jgi:hypothetical protein